MYKVFIVEDEELLRTGMRDNVKWKENGYEFCGEASDGEEALPLVRKIIPDIIITDIKMPFMNGLELSKIIKEESPNTKIIVLTGYDEFDFAREALSIGADEYILKPFSASKLIEALNGISQKIQKDKEKKIWNYEKYIIERDLVKKLKEKEYNVNEDFYKNDNENIEEFFKFGKLEHIESFLDEYMKRLESASLHSYIYTYYTLMNIFMIASKFIRDMKESVNEIIPEMKDMEVLCLSINSIEELRVHINQIFVRILSFRDNHKVDKYGKIIEEAKKFINKKYMIPELSLNLVAYNINVSPNHFSTIFKNGTGEAFIDYLTKIRINKAKEYLNSSPMKTYEIAESVGYADSHYFSYIFKKITGLTPSEYRKNSK